MDSILYSIGNVFYHMFMSMECVRVFGCPPTSTGISVSTLWFSSLRGNSFSEILVETVAFQSSGRNKVFNAFGNRDQMGECLCNIYSKPAF